MKLNWEHFKGKLANVTLHENYGLDDDKRSKVIFYEILLKLGILESVYDEGLLLESMLHNCRVNVFIPHSSIECDEIFDDFEDEND